MIQRWDMFLRIAETKVADKSKAKSTASSFNNEYRSKHYLEVMPFDAVSLDDLVFVHFYKKILADKGFKNRIPSPVEQLPNSSWMIDSDFCFLNVRAVGANPKVPGNFIDALKLLPMLRVNSIHLAPFFASVFGNVYAVDSLTDLNPEVINPIYEKAGLSGEDQLQLLIDAIHLLDMTVGFDLEPHTSQFSQIVLDNPEKFRWIELSNDRSGLVDGITQLKMMGEKNQKVIQEKVKTIVKQNLAKFNISSLTDKNISYSKRKEIKDATIGELIEQGLWTMPCHTWNGVGLPKFKKYNKEANYPEFDYRDIKGKDQSDQAFGMLTPFKFATNLKLNKMATEKSQPKPWGEGIEFFASIFPNIRKKFEFDFVRLDYVDHVFDSIYDYNPEIPISDRVTPALLQRVIEKAKEGAPFVGAMAERMGYDIANYGKIGFDLILGADVIRFPDMQFVADALRFNKEIGDINRAFEHRSSIQYAVDSHDTGHPGIDTNPTKYGKKGLLLRFFLSRFSSCGIGRRAKYEVIGNQDMTSGLYIANNEAVSLQWANNKEFFKIYHNFEDVYNLFRKTLENSIIAEIVLEEDYAVWYIDRQDGFLTRLACVVYPSLKKTKVFSNLKIFPFNQYGFREAQVEAVNLETGVFSDCSLDPEGFIHLNDLAPGDVQLFFIHEKGSILPESV